jgi:hypothetical protein
MVRTTLRPSAEIAEQFPGFVTGAGDVNGDGFDDVVAGSVRSGGVSLFLGTRVSVSEGPAAVVQMAMSAGADTSWFARGIGDFDGDGFDDVAITGEVEARIFWGGADGLSNARSLLVATDRAGLRGPYFDGVGDMNGDRCPDAVLLMFDPAGHRFDLVAGGARALRVTPLTFRLPNGSPPRLTGTSDFGYANDLDRDGFPDLFYLGTCQTRSPCPDRAPRETFWVRGTEAHTATPPAVATPEEAQRVETIGDRDGDGAFDVIVWSPNTTTAAMYACTRTGPAARATMQVTAPPGASFAETAAGTVW